MKKIPLRKCVATQEQLPKSELIRIVKNNEGQVFIDPTSKANGRGAYLKKSLEAIELAQKRKALDRALGVKIDDELYERLKLYVNSSKN